MRFLLWFIDSMQQLTNSDWQDRYVFEFESVFGWAERWLDHKALSTIKMISYDGCFDVWLILVRLKSFSQNSWPCWSKENSHFLLALLLIVLHKYIQYYHEDDIVRHTTQRTRRKFFINCFVRNDSEVEWLVSTAVRGSTCSCPCVWHRISFYTWGVWHRAHAYYTTSRREIVLNTARAFIEFGGNDTIATTKTLQYR